MKPYQVLSTVIVVVLINNVLLLSYLSDDDESQVVITQENSERAVRTKPLANVSAVSNRSSGPDSGFASQAEQQPDTRLDAEISEAIRQYLRSNEFKRELNSYQAEFSSQFEGMQSRLSAMSGAELYSVAIDSSNPSEQEYAQTLLMQNGLDELDTTQIKSLYLADDVNNWNKESLLLRLLEESDPDAIGWAKQRLVDGSARQYQNPEIYSAVYDADPEFIKQHIRDLNLNNPQQSVAALTFIMQDSELAKSFYEQNFDKLLDAKSSQIYQYLHYSTELKLSNRQQSKLVELFDSGNRRQREFAISQARNINDVNVLRDVYSRLPKNSEKLKFLQILSSAGSNTEVTTLVQELAAESDNASIKRMIRN